MGRLGNALSQMHLDSRSENLLEEKELEDIEKKPARQSPRQSPTHSDRIDSSGHHSHGKEILPSNSSSKLDGSSGERSRSPPQKGQLIRGKLWQTS